MSDRKSTTVYDHPAFLPNPIPPAPDLHLPDGRRLPTLGEVLFLPLNVLAKLSLGYLNLLCATMLADTSDLDISNCMRTLGEWTAMVKRETARQLPRFRAKPTDYENSEAYFRVLVMVTVLERDLGVKYDPEAMKTRQFKSSREGFIHGLLTGNRTGTCSNLPVLHAAIGRNLGYPIYLVTAKGHLFCRWHSIRTGERFNIAAAGRGLSVPPDSYYMKWPRPITDAEVHHGIYLRNLDPMEELGLFMATRGHCLEEKGHWLDAIIAYAHAHRLAPACPEHMSFLMGALNIEIDMRKDGRLPCTYRQAEIFNRADCPPLARYIIDDRYRTRTGSLALDDKKSGPDGPKD